MDTDSFPVVESILIKDEDDSYIESPESEQVDPFFEETVPESNESIDIKYEFPEPPSPKKRRGRPPSSKKAEPVPASIGASPSKPCTAKPSIKDNETVQNVEPETDFGDATRDEENQNNPTAQDSTETARTNVAELTDSSETCKSLKLEMNELSLQRDALQVQLKSVEEKAERKISELEATVAELLAKNQSCKDLEIKLIKLSVERDKLEESQKKSSEELDETLSELEMSAGNLLAANKELHLKMNEVTNERDALKVKLEEMNKKLCKLEAAAFEDLAEKKISVKTIGLEPDLKQADLDLEQKMKACLATIAEKIKLEEKNDVKKVVGDTGRKSEDPSYTPPQKKKRKHGNQSSTPDYSTHTRTHSMSTRSRTVTAQVNGSLPKGRSRTRTRKTL